MGEVTNQYSAEEIIEKYYKHIHNYNSIIEELKNIMGNAYIKKQNIADFFELDRKSTRLNSSHSQQSRMPSSA